MNPYNRVQVQQKSREIWAHDRHPALTTRYPYPTPVQLRLCLALASRCSVGITLIVRCHSSPVCTVLLPLIPQATIAIL